MHRADGAQKKWGNSIPALCSAGQPTAYACGAEKVEFLPGDFKGGITAAIGKVASCGSANGYSVSCAAMISYTDDITGITPPMLAGFFVGWPNPPSPEMHLEVLRGSYAVILALEEDRVVGFVNAISDGRLAAFIPLLEVLPERQGEKIGSELMRRMREKLSGFYSLDLVCDPDVQPFYERIGWRKSVGMSLRNYDRSRGT